MTFGALGVPTARVRGPSYRFLSAGTGLERVGDV